MMNKSKVLEDIHIIRETIYEETKNMTPVERTKHANDEAENLIREFNMEVKYKNIKENK